LFGAPFLEPQEENFRDLMELLLKEGKGQTAHGKK